MNTLDLGPLSASVSRAELAAFRRQNAFGTELVLRVVLGVIVVLVGVMAVVFLMDSTATGPNAFGSSASGGQPIALAVVVVIVGAGLFALSAFFSRLTWTRRYRISQFASSNGLVFAMRAGGPSYPGIIFTLGRDQSVTEQLFSVGDKQLDIGNYRYTTGSGKNKKTHTWGYVAIKLERKLPHMMLDARSNNFLGTNLPATFSRDQILKLEGDFDRHFTLYCPRQYETDALYVFTPDLMALFIDEASQWDAEIVDDWMFLYSTGTIDLSDVSVMARVFRLISTVGDKTRDRSARYADSTVTGPGAGSGPGPGPAIASRQAIDLVAPHGRRLAPGIPVVGVIVVGVVVLILLSNLLPAIGGA